MVYARWGCFVSDYFLMEFIFLVPHLLEEGKKLVCTYNNIVQFSLSIR